jgi:hypothetical protein
MEFSVNELPDRILRPEFEMWLRADGIVQLVWAPRTTMHLEHAQAAIEAMTSITSGHAALLLVDTRRLGVQDRDARMEFVRRGDLVKAVALIVDSPLNRMMGQFFINVSRPVVSTRLFENETAAAAWLLEQAVAPPGSAVDQ